MKQLFFFFLFIISLSSCTVVKITNSFNSYSGCHYAENTAVSIDGVEIIVKGSSCDYQEFLSSKLDKNILLSKGYKMVTDYNTVVFLSPASHQY